MFFYIILISCSLYCPPFLLLFFPFPIHSFLWYRNIFPSNPFIFSPFVCYEYFYEFIVFSFWCPVISHFPLIFRPLFSFSMISPLFPSFFLKFFTSYFCVSFAFFLPFYFSPTSLPVIASLPVVVLFYSVRVRAAPSPGRASGEEVFPLRRFAFLASKLAG